MKEIAKNQFYEISIDRNKNRIYGILIGFWKNKDDIINFSRDVESGLNQLATNFTMLMDLREFKTPPADVKEYMADVMKLVMNKGVKKVADVITSAITKMATDNMASSKGFQKSNFNSIEEAEDWLGK